MFSCYLGNIDMTGKEFQSLKQCSGSNIVFLTLLKLIVTNGHKESIRNLGLRLLFQGRSSCKFVFNCDVNTTVTVIC